MLPLIYIKGTFHNKMMCIWHAAALLFLLGNQYHLLEGYCLHDFDTHYRTNSAKSLGVSFVQDFFPILNPQAYPGHCWLSFV